MSSAPESDPSDEPRTTATGALEGRVAGPITILVCLSVVLQSASLLLLSAGLVVGILCTVVAFVLDRLKAPSAVVLATVLVIQLLGLHLAEAHQAEPRFRVFAQFGGTLLAVYAPGLWILGIGAFGRASDRPTR